MPDLDGAVRFLEEHGAAQIEHPGGTLLAHLRRTARQLAEWEAADDLVLAGLCHATYGTDGFPQPLIEWTERQDLRDVIGPEAEGIVYFYASCDRGFFYPQLDRRDPLAFRDRVTGEERPPSAHELRDFMELTFANELDIVNQSPTFAAEHGPGIARLFARCTDLVSPPAVERFHELLPAS
jgi:hypothetical protein